jgi:hypothetical protein
MIAEPASHDTTGQIQADSQEDAFMMKTFCGGLMVAALAGVGCGQSNPQGQLSDFDSTCDSAPGDSNSTSCLRGTIGPYREMNAKAGTPEISSDGQYITLHASDPQESWSSMAVLRVNLPNGLYDHSLRPGSRVQAYSGTYDSYQTESVNSLGCAGPYGNPYPNERRMEYTELEIQEGRTPGTYRAVFHSDHYDAYTGEYQRMDVAFDYPAH